ncbi:uncharacterized protein N7483_005703 [Penicillium malachiteum]|uniref:uncharacterized protein n=1 Tax=Penicillium malachiteum TaxID=1324776 RepID=UPI002549273F|nr:uncharacterized protein N7483_005703 [Penicillium malachiteum]KAJ5731195.1 hypothetical protein N7483_005703 [Penicillium malachiteum]
MQHLDTNLGSEADTVVTSPWDTGEVGLFYPNNLKNNHVKTKHHTLIFHNVYAFVSHLRALIGFKLENEMRANIQSCLREEALEWFITELNNSKRHALQTLPLEEGWFKQLLQRFSVPPRRALFRCERVDFSVGNVYRKTHNLVRNLQAAGKHDEDKQARAIWRKLNSSHHYKESIPLPKPGAPLSKLLRDIHFLSHENGYQENDDGSGCDDDYDDNIHGSYEVVQMESRELSVRSQQLECLEDSNVLHSCFVFGIMPLR